MKILSLLLLSSLLLPAAEAKMKSLSKKEITQILMQGRIETSWTRTIKRHFRDSNKFYPNPAAMALITDLPKPKRITGSNNIAGILPWKYSHTTLHKDGKLIILARIHVKNANQAQIALLEENLQAAEDYWNRDRPENLVGFPYEFQFEVVNSAKSADISFKFVKGTRGPFYSKWDPGWSEIEISHEMGHVLGLSDEYDEISRNTTDLGCDHRSMMCNAWAIYNPGTIKFHHYYHILRRVIDQ